MSECENGKLIPRFKVIVTIVRLSAVDAFLLERKVKKIAQEPLTVK